MSEARAEIPARPTAARRALTIGFYAIVVALLAYYLSQLDFALLGRLSIRLEYLAAAAVLGLAQRLLLPLVWALLMRDLGVPIRRYAMCNLVYARAWLGRYLPGRVAMLGARIFLAEELGASRSVVVVSSIAEIGAQMAVGAAFGLLGIASLARSFDAIEAYVPIALGMIALVAVFLWPPVFNAAMGVAFRVFKRSHAERPRVGARTLAWAVGGWTLVSAIAAATAVAIGAAVDPGPALAHPLFVGGTMLLAGTLGVAFVVAPAGLGAREAVQLPLLTLVFSNEAALAIVVLSRLAEIVLDGIFYAISAVWARLARAA